MAQGDGDEGLHACFPWKIDKREVAGGGVTLQTHRDDGSSPRRVSFEC